MAQEIIRTFKLNLDGIFDEIMGEKTNKTFKIVKILTNYIQKIKKMYFWIGTQPIQSLKNQISRIRESIKEEFPQLRILQNKTFEMRDTPFDFLSIGE